MWGHPGHLSELNRLIGEAYPSSLDGTQLEVLVAETNSEDSTYDGIDWGGERVAKEVEDKVADIEKDGKTVSRFSVTGYSLGGLIARYVVGILHQKGFFDKITPVNFNTIATPHIGLPRYASFLSSLTSSLGPKLLSRTGEQFYLVDKWSATGRPLIEVMADPNRIFHQGLQTFEQIRIYANALHDVTVPYVTSAIETEDPFALYESNGIEVFVIQRVFRFSSFDASRNSELDDEYSPLVKRFSVPDIPPPRTPKPVVLSREWFKNRKNARPILPPAFQLRFPLNFVLYSLLPLLVPVALSLVVVRFTLASRSSRARIRLLEEDQLNGQKLINILAALEDEVEDAVVDLVIDHSPDESQATSSSSPSTGKREGSPHPISNDLILVAKIDMIEEGSATPDTESSSGATTPIPTALATSAPSSSSSTIGGKKKKAKHPPEQPILTPVQRKIAGWLNQLPLRKELAYFPDLRNSHATIVCRDVKRFEAHRRGEGIIRHWAASFIL
ncbi:hypothetical protein DXG03_005408 [Asterophora parasitica]|uniref:DUF676 domain-containing protein n=1 Tax=Asterophora parasitica TaxID=117018 RepID=A0A9P7G8Z9_9AGAR|nr:hypothetical protein DXG03_005408 [Asterophora parasitica]